MRTTLSLFFITIYLLNIGAQSDYTLIDSTSRKTPHSLKNYDAIAWHLTQNLSEESDKARALYVWIAHNLSYDFSINTTQFDYQYEGQTIDEALKKRKGVCQHYADLYHAMAQSIGLESYVISGYTRDYLGRIANASHAWNMIKMNASYYFVDVTWASGRILNRKYDNTFSDDFFLITPEVFIKDHMPFDPIWQCLSAPLLHREFITNDYSKLNGKGNFTFDKYIEEYKSSNSLEQLEGATQRIKKCGISNKLIESKINENLTLITNEKYNNAVNILNEAIFSYNAYITAKNKRFSEPKLEDEQIQTMITTADFGLLSAQRIFKTLETKDQQLKNTISETIKLMNEIIPELKCEKEFVAKYLGTNKATRAKLFQNSK